MPKYSDGTHVVDVRSNEEYTIEESLKDHNGNFTGAYIVKYSNGKLRSGILERHLNPRGTPSKVNLSKLKIYNRTPDKVSAGHNTVIELDGHIMGNVSFIKVEFGAKKATKVLMELFVTSVEIEPGVVSVNQTERVVKTRELVPFEVIDGKISENHLVGVVKPTPSGGWARLVDGAVVATLDRSRVIWK